MITSSEEFSSCVITKMEGEDLNTYSIKHNKSGEVIYTCQQASAYKIARLLDLENEFYKLVNERNIS